MDLLEMIGIVGNIFSASYGFRNFPLDYHIWSFFYSVVYSPVMLILSSCVWFFCTLTWYIYSMMYAATLLAIDEGAWWNGKDKCKALCCSGRGHSWTL